MDLKDGTTGPWWAAQMQQYVNRTSSLCEITTARGPKLTELLRSLHELNVIQDDTQMNTPTYLLQQGKQLCPIFRGFATPNTTNSSKIQKHSTPCPNLGWSEVSGLRADPEILYQSTITCAKRLWDSNFVLFLGPQTNQFERFLPLLLNPTHVSWERTSWNWTRSWSNQSISNNLAP
eukprot:TRINITY_DN63402_c0_g2_i1.p2 TRINITY_DN63402_c0_g2~~TRINITY_DN63402_c0_g2_i1.p2  ORF type:complete len:177 (+),score=3.28 TRINITY_DN63402_c0_g2_i1:102-632(+)